MHLDMPQPEPWLNELSANRAVILLYHRINRLALDPQFLCVEPDNFAQHLQAISNYRVVTIAQLTQDLLRGQLPAPTVAISFDDGYADNLEFAQPMLAEFKLPATIFISADTIDNTSEFYWDQLEQLLLVPPQLPDRLSLIVNEETISISLDGNFVDATAAALYEQLKNSVAANEQASPADKKSVVGERAGIYYFVCNLLRNLTPQARRTAIESLSDSCGISLTVRDTHRGVSAAQLSQLAADKSIEIGSHALSHCRLSSLTLEEQQDEIENSKEKIQDLSKRQISSFAFPFGARGDFNDATIELVRNAGYQAACANFPDVVYRRGNRFCLPRLLVRNCDGQYLGPWLASWLNQSNS